MALDFFAGCVGGAAGVIVGHPFDTVKVRLQTQSPTNIKYRGTFHCLTTIVKQESVSGLYKGISSPLFGVAGVNAIIFGVYGALRPYVSGAPGNDALWAHFIAGSISGAVQSVVASPMELVKTRLQINQDAVGTKKLGPVETLRGIYKNEGGLFRGVFKGWGITIGREIPGFGVYFASYEAMTRMSEGQVGTLGMLMAGGMAGVISWIVTFPIDVVKTRLQCDDCGKYSGAFDCARKTYAAEGYRAFSRGLVSTVLRAFPTNAATFTVVTWIMRLAGEAPQDEIQDCKNYLNELLKETNRLQEKLEQSLHLKVPHYFCGNSLTSCSLASECAVSAQKSVDKTQLYFNFYQTLQHQVRAANRRVYADGLSAESDEAQDVEEDGQKPMSALRGKLTEFGLNNTANMQSLQSTCISSRPDASTDIPHSLQPPASSTEKESEREICASPNSTASCENDNVSSLIQGNHVLSHEAALFPASQQTQPQPLETRIAGADNDKNVDEPVHLSCTNRRLSSGGLTYLSKSLDIPVNILEAANLQQRRHEISREPTQKQLQTPSTLTRTISRSSSKPQPWKMYYPTSAVNFCKCFEDHCVCVL